MCLSWSKLTFKVIINRRVNVVTKYSLVLFKSYLSSFFPNDHCSTFLHSTFCQIISNIYALHYLFYSLSQGRVSLKQSTAFECHIFSEAKSSWKIGSALTYFHFPGAQTVLGTLEVFLLL